VLVLGPLAVPYGAKRLPPATEPPAEDNSDDAPAG